MTAVRVALPCGRLVNLCIPCASTFARFLSKRIRDLARDSISDKNGLRALAAGQSSQLDCDAKGPTGKFRGAMGQDVFRSGTSSEMATEQLQDRAMDVLSASKILGRTKGQIPDNAGGGLSPTFRARRANRANSQGEFSFREAMTTDDRGVAHRIAQPRDMHLSGAVATQVPMIVADPRSASPFGALNTSINTFSRENDRPAAEWHSASLGSKQRAAGSHQPDQTPPGSSKSSKSRQGHGRRQRAQDNGHDRDKRGANVAASALQDAPARSSRQQQRPTSNMFSSSLERDRTVLPNGKTALQTSLADGKMGSSGNFLPELRGARAETLLPLHGGSQVLRMNSDSLMSGNSAPVNSPSTQQQGAKDSAWRNRVAGRGAQGHIDGVISALDRFDSKMSHKSSRKHAPMADSAKEIRQKMIQDLQNQTNSGPQHSWSNGKKLNTSIPLKLALSSSAFSVS